jgi:hypothetical protein
MACSLCGLIGRYLVRNGREFDVAVDTLLGGPENQTVSVSCALARLRGAWWGIALCALLSVLIQRNHCSVVLSTENTTAGTALRSAIAFTVALVALAAIVHALIELL